jgi:Peptidase inhibitor I78 family
VGSCNAEGSNQLIGQAATSETGAAILKATNSRVLRWAPPGVMLTMDFSPSRVTVRLGPDDKVMAINCG